MKESNNRFRILILTLLLLVAGRILAQCPDPELYDQTLANTSDSPTWVNCIDNPAQPDGYTLNVVSPNDIQDYVIDFGDGSPTISGALLPANTAITHVYADLGEYEFRLYETRNACTDSVVGIVINDRKPGASAQPPTLGSSGCVPHDLTFTNQTSNVSRFTEFVWEWGDGETDTLAHTTVGQPITHTYVKDRSGCDMNVRISANSLCASSFSVYGPYDFWDVDSARVAASATQLCNGDTVTFTDRTLYNCNITQPRVIQWDFTNVGGPTTSWLPAVGDNRSQKFFIQGNPGDRFTVSLLDSNYCGIDANSVEVEIIAPPQAAIDPSPTICAGETATFGNSSTGDATIYYWDFGDGSPLTSTSGRTTVSHTFENDGTYEVKLIASIQDAGRCSDTTSVMLEVLPASESEFSMDNSEGCGVVDVSFTDNSQDAISWEWDFGIFGNYSGQNPPQKTFSGAGTYAVTLTTVNSIGCGDEQTKTVTVFPEVFAGFSSDPVCLGNETRFTDQTTLPSISCATGEIVQDLWYNINGNDVSDLTDDANYPNNPDDTKLLTIFEAPRNVDDEYGSRIHGFVCPPITGNYRFWISSDDDSELWLSTDGDPANKVLIASVNGFTASREWDKFNSQRSANIQLNAGQRYYIEAIHKDAGGGDHIAVGWQLPTGVRERPIPGSRLAPYAEGNALQTWSWDFGDGLGTSTEQNPNYLFDTPGQYNVTLDVSTGKCSGTHSLIVDVNLPPTAVLDLDDTARCTPFDANFENNSTDGAKFYWDFGDGSRVVEKNSDEDTRHLFVNTGTTNLTYLVSLVAESVEGCTDTAYQSIVIYPGPVAGFNFDPVLPQCSPSTIDFENLSIGADDYNWYIGDYDTLTTSEDEFSYDFINQSGALRFDTIRLEVSSNAGCSGTDQKIVAVYPEPEFEIISLPDTGCQPARINFLVTGSPVSANWDFDDGNFSTQTAPIHEFKNFGNTQQTYNVSLRAESFFGCKDTVYKDIIVFPKPNANFTMDKNSGCGPLDITFNNTSTGNQFSYWFYGNGNSDTINTNPVHTYINNTRSVQVFDAQLIVENANGCTDSLTKSVTVYPKVTASFDALDTAGCTPFNVGYQNFSTGAVDYVWNFGDGAVSLEENPAHLFLNSNTSDSVFTTQLIARSSFNCFDTTYRDYVVFAKPRVDITASSNIGCGPLPITFTNNTESADSYLWDFGDGMTSDTTASTFDHIYSNFENNSKTFTAKLSAFSEKGCRDEGTVQVTLYPFVNALFEPTDTIGCSPLPVGFQNFSVGSTNYSWAFGDDAVSNQSTPLHIFDNTGQNDTVFTVSLVASSPFGCRDTLTKDITVHPKPKAEFGQDVSEGCHPLDVSFSNNSQGFDNASWRFGDGNIVSTNDVIVDHTYSNISSSTINFPVTLTVSNDFGCGDTLTTSVGVFPYVQARFVSSDTAGCSPWKINFQNSSTNAQTYSWLFGDGESASKMNTSHTYTNNSFQDSIFTTTLIARSQFNCTDTISREMLIYSKPKADFFTSKTEGCTPFITDIQNISEGHVSSFWQLGNSRNSNNNDPNFENTFINSSDSDALVNIDLVVTSDRQCKDTTTNQVRVFPATTALQTPSTIRGCTPLFIEFDNFSNNAAVSVWDFGDESNPISSRDVVHEFINPGLNDTSYTVTLVTSTSKNCKDTTTQVITVYPRPVPEFTPNPLTILPEESVEFTNNTEGDWSYQWDFDDPASGAANTSLVMNPDPHQYNTTGTYNIRLTATSVRGCADSVTNFIRVIAIPPEPDFTGKGTGCGQLTVNFQNETFNGDFFTWDFGDGQSLNINNMSDVPHTYYNNTNLVQRYSVTLLAENSAQLSQSYTQHQDSIVVYPNPEISFKARPDTIFLPGEVFFSNFTINGSRFLWDFGDGTTSREENPRHEYKEAGDYEVTLIAESEFGCIDTLTLENIVIARDGGLIIMPNAFTPNNGGPGDGRMDSAGLNDVFGPGYIQGVVDYNFQIFNQWGELIFESEDMNIGWDGYYRDELAEEGVYVWKITAKYADDTEKELIGDVTLIRYDN